MVSSYSIPRLYRLQIEALVASGYYTSKSDVVKDALRHLFETQDHLRQAAAIELYRRGQLTLSKAAELAGSNLEEFKEVLRDQGISPTVQDLAGVDWDTQENLRLSAAVELYRRGQMNLAKAADLAGLSRQAFVKTLKDAGVGVSASEAATIEWETD